MSILEKIYVSETDFERSDKRNSTRYNMAKEIVDASPKNLVMPSKVLLAPFLVKKATGRGFVPNEIGSIVKKSTSELASQTYQEILRKGSLKKV